MEDLAEVGRDVFKEAKAQRHGDAAKLTVGGFDAGGQETILVGPLETLTTAALVLKPRIGDQSDEGGKGEDLLETGATMGLEDPIKGRGVENE